MAKDNNKLMCEIVLILLCSGAAKILDTFGKTQRIKVKGGQSAGQHANIVKVLYNIHAQNNMCM